jgi:hypothetical protein
MLIGGLGIGGKEKKKIKNKKHCFYITYKQWPDMGVDLVMIFSWPLKVNIFWRSVIGIYEVIYVECQAALLNYEALTGTSISGSKAKVELEEQVIDVEFTTSRISAPSVAFYCGTFFPFLLLLPPLLLLFLFFFCTGEGRH